MGKRNWEGKQSEQKAVYRNRWRVQAQYGRSLLRRRGELVDRSFAHRYETGGMRRCTLRGQESILKRLLTHVGAFNISLVLRNMLGAGTPRALRNGAGSPLLRLFLLITYRHWPDRAVESRTALVLPSPSVCRSVRPRCRSFWNLAPCTTGCLEQHLLTIGISILGVQS